MFGAMEKLGGGLTFYNMEKRLMVHRALFDAYYDLTFDFQKMVITCTPLELDETVQKLGLSHPAVPPPKLRVKLYFNRDGTEMCAACQLPVVGQGVPITYCEGGIMHPTCAIVMHSVYGPRVLPSCIAGIFGRTCCS